MANVGSKKIRSGDVLQYEQGASQGFSRSMNAVYVEDGMRVGAIVQWVPGNSRYEWVADADVATLAADVRVLIDDFIYDKDLTGLPQEMTLATLDDDSIVGRTFLQYADAVTPANQAIVETALKDRGVKVTDQVPANS
jgi:hypothetical protein